MYRATRDLILSPSNEYFYASASLSGLGSPHTPQRYVWPLAHMVEALTLPEGDSIAAARQAALLGQLLKLQCGNRLMHESVSVDDLSQCTRPVFEW